jgi:hypothetical protein
MRTLLELIIAAAIIAIGWEKSLKDRAQDLPWFADRPTNTQNRSQSSTVNSRPSPTTPGAWMWDPKRQSILDTPKPKTATVPVPASTPGTWLFDPSHRSALDPPKKNHQAPTPP